MSKKDDYVSLMESQMKRWDEAVDQMTKKGQQIGAEAKAEYEKQVKAMRAERDRAYEKLQALRASNESAWQTMQSGVESAWTSMQTALDKARSKYK